jgi:hypothetical protein
LTASLLPSRHPVFEILRFYEIDKGQDLRRQGRGQDERRNEIAPKVVYENEDGQRERDAPPQEDQEDDGHGDQKPAAFLIDDIELDREKDDKREREREQGHIRHAIDRVARFQQGDQTKQAVANVKHCFQNDDAIPDRQQNALGHAAHLSLTVIEYSPGRDAAASRGEENMYSANGGRVTTDSADKTDEDRKGFGNKTEYPLPNIEHKVSTIPAHQYYGKNPQSQNS